VDAGFKRSDSRGVCTDDPDGEDVGASIGAAARFAEAVIATRQSRAVTRKAAPPGGVVTGGRGVTGIGGVDRKSG
jgi:hypothetical protein